MKYRIANYTTPEVDSIFWWAGSTACPPNPLGAGCMSEVFDSNDDVEWIQVIDNSSKDVMCNIAFPANGNGGSATFIVKGMNNYTCTPGV